MKDASLLRRTLPTSDPGWGVLAVSVEWTIGMPLRRLSANFGGLSAEVVPRQGAAFPPRFSGVFCRFVRGSLLSKIQYREKNKESRKINRIRRKCGPSALLSQQQSAQGQEQIPRDDAISNCSYKVMKLSKSEEKTNEMCGN
jgi:hypothetical protein